MSQAPITMIIETAFGVLVRDVPGASPLPPDLSGGEASEDATHAAAVLCMPDFVFRAKVLRKGSASREVGDRLLVVGELGVVVQVKRREGELGDEDEERSWLEKSAKKALRQGHGTIRTLRSGPLRLTNHRGREIEVDGNDLRWLAVAVLDHPDPPLGVTPNAEAGPDSAVVLLRRDWEFLFTQLKSSHALGEYLERVVGESWELGAEPSRYFQLANADAHASRQPIDVEVLGAGARVVGGPLLPIDPAGSGEDEMPLLFLRSLYEDIAVASSLDVMTEENRLHVLAELDRLGVAQRVGIAEFLLNAMGGAATDAAAERVVWRQRQYVGRLDAPRPVHIAGLFALTNGTARFAQGSRAGSVSDIIKWARDSGGMTT
jgi:hypothetical protein